MEDLFDEVFAPDSDAYLEYFYNRKTKNDKNQKEAIAKNDEWEK